MTANISLLDPILWYSNVSHLPVAERCPVLLVLSLFITHWRFCAQNISSPLQWLMAPWFPWVWCRVSTTDYSSLWSTHRIMSRRSSSVGSNPCVRITCKWVTIIFQHFDIFRLSFFRKYSLNICCWFQRIQAKRPQLPVRNENNFVVKSFNFWCCSTPYNISNIHFHCEPHLLQGFK